MEEKAQGAIEYLLIIGAAILVVAIVIIAITSVMGGGQKGLNEGLTAEQKASNTGRCQLDITVLGDVDADPIVCATTNATTKAECKCCSDGTLVTLENTVAVCQ
jgi:hypothetical protein